MNKTSLSKEIINFNDIRRENSSGDEEEEDSGRFPYPLTKDILNKTNSNTINPLGKERWNLVKDQVVDKDKNKWRNLVKSAQNNTKSFLGIDNNYSLGNPHNQSVENSKSLSNWNERVFKVMNNNSIFGGELKERKLDQYIHKLNENHVDQANPFLFYKLTGGSQLDLVPKITVANMAVDGLRKLTKKLKKQEISMIDPSYITEDQSSKETNRVRMHSLKEGQQIDIEIEDRIEDNIDGPWDAFTHAFYGSRMFGVGFCGRLCDNDIDPDKKFKYEDLLKTIKQHRPYFTYWVTFVQMVVCIVSIIAYGMAPIGFSYELKSGIATTITLEKQYISYPVKQNFWIGPAIMDLVHLGAKYGPCMRNDSNIYNAIQKDVAREKDTACCIRNDRGGCVQTNQKQCTKLMSQWYKWNTSEFIATSNFDGAPRTSGSVCGLDPMFCADTNSIAVKNDWIDDISQWPVCQKQTGLVNASQKDYRHMYCEIIGRPCCIGIQGECMITTLEHCDLMRGYFHNDANLCSQVDCMQQVCGMIDFLHEKNPDQVYRLFTSIFIHAGILQLLVTIFFQLFILRDVEKLAGFLRVSIVYVASGVIGNLGSALFLPYQAEVGPLGSQFGIIACLFVEMFHAWGIYKKPWLVFAKLTACLLILFLIGFLPMIDNFANLFGFLSGLLLAAILFPDIDIKGQCRRAIVISVCISFTITIVGALIVLFYVKPFENCPYCKFFSCPFGNKYCLEMDFNITRLEK